MNIKQIEIINFKSIKYVNIPLKSYGQGNDKSNTLIFVGINESGKSNILEAIDAANHLFDGYDYNTNYCKLSDRDTDFIIVRYLFNEIKIDEAIEEASKQLKFPERLYKQLRGNINYLYRSIYFDNENRYDAFYITFSSNILWHHFQVGPSGDIKNINFDLNKVINQNEAEKYIDENYLLLNEDKFTSIFLAAVRSFLLEDFPKIIYWRSTNEYLINEQISLTKFRNDPSISLPLKNIFRIYGCQDIEEIRNIIEKALTNEEFKSELEDTLSHVVTKHINNIWKEHKVKFIIKFDNDICKVHVEDHDVKYKYYKMGNRSDGFKQFVSLMLSLSAENNSNVLKDNILLLDEPEVHLHPSGVRYLRDELLRIGLKNYVFVSTHSHYLIDTKVPQRHWIVEKSKDTTINQINDIGNLHDDEVVTKAFGIEFMKDLLPNIVLIVEGIGDKNIFSNSIKFFGKDLNYVIKNAGGCSKVYSIASILAGESLKSFILLDGDDEGVKTKRDILKNLKENFSVKNVFTLNDVMHGLPEKATIEDLYPIDFLNNFLSQRLESNCNLNYSSSVIQQLKRQFPYFAESKNKEKLDNLKKDMTVKFLKDYKTNKQIVENAIRYTEFSQTLIEKIKDASAGSA